MVDLGDLLNEYVEATLNIHDVDSSFKRKKYIKKTISIVDKVYKHNLQDRFFIGFYQSGTPFLLYDIAVDSLDRGYNIEKSFEIVMYLKENAYNLEFNVDEEKNKKFQKEFHNAKFSRFVSEYNIYRKFSDETLYQEYHKYWKLLSNPYNWYIEKINIKNSCISWDEEVSNLLQSINKQIELEKFFEIISEGFEESPAYMKILNGYYTWKFTDDNESSLKLIDNFKKIKEMKLPSEMNNFIVDYKENIR